ncbi:biotin/lipoyl-containing protein [Candidatus Riflebacteria bacterium]
MKKSLKIIDILEVLKNYPFHRVDLKARKFSVTVARKRKAAEMAQQPIHAGIPEKPKKITALVDLKSERIGFFFNGETKHGIEKILVKTGDRLKKGQLLGFIRRLDQVEEIKSQISGKVVKILKKDGDSIEYGETIFQLEETE